jgi:hypothetical protein
MNLGDRWNDVVRAARSQGFTEDVPGFSRVGSGPTVTLGLYRTRADGEGNEFFLPSAEYVINPGAWVEMWSAPIANIEHLSFRRRRFPRLLFGLGSGIGTKAARRFDIHGRPRAGLLRIFTPDVANALYRLRSCPTWQLHQYTPIGKGSICVNFTLAHADARVFDDTLGILRALYATA